MIVDDDDALLVLTIANQCQKWQRAYTVGEDDYI
jgi:hypothetical protein